MKKSFYELMDNYDGEDITDDCGVSADKVKEIVFDRITPAKKRNKMSRRCIALIAAASVAATAGLAVTAYETGALSAALSFFRDNPMSEQPVTFTSRDFDNIRNNLKEENLTAESEGAKIQLTGSMHDENVIYLFCTMTLADGVLLPENLDALDFEVNNIDIPVDGRNYGNSRFVQFSDYNIPGSNTLDFTCVIYFTGDVVTDEVSGLLLEDLGIMGDEPVSGVNGPHYLSSTIQKGKWLIPLRYKEETPMTEITEEPVTAHLPANPKDDIDVHSLKLDSVKISPLTLEIHGSEPDREPTAHNTQYMPNSLKDYIKITMKDGSEQTLTTDSYCFGIMGNVEEFCEVLPFEKPVDVSQIDVVKIGDAEIKVN